jgi:flagellin-like protein
MENRSVSPVISVILMVAVVVILAAVLSVIVLGFSEDLDDPAPNVAETTGEFEAGGNSDEQNVRITHIAGDKVDVEEIEIIVRVSRPNTDDIEVRLIDLPGDGYFSYTLADENILGEDDLIDQGPDGTSRIIVVDDSNVWTAGDTIQFRIAVQEADFRDPPDLDPSNPRADELEVLVIHTESNSILTEHTFNP